MILRNRLKVYRAMLNVNQQEMGRLCGVSRQTISLIERGDYSPSCHPRPDGCESLRRSGRRNFLLAGGNRT